MIRTFFTLIVGLLLSLGIFWLSQNSGKLIFSLFGYHIEIELYAACILFIFFLSILILTGWFLLRLITLPLRLTKLFKPNILRRLEELMINIANGDYNRSLRIYNQLEKLNLPLTLINLLKMEVMMLGGDINLQKEVFIKLSHDPSTKNIGLEGMLELAQHEENYPLVIEYGLILHNNCNNKFIELTIINAYFAMQKWKEMIEFLHHKKLCMSKILSKTLLGIAYYKQAEDEFLVQEFSHAKEHLVEAARYLPNFLPIFILHLKIAEAFNDSEEILYHIKKAWSIMPHYEVANFFFKLRETLTEDKYLRFAHKIAALNYDHYESHMLLAKIGLDVGDITLAEQELSLSLSQELRFRACLLMAEFCYKTHGNASETIEWVQRAVHSKFDVLYTAFYLNPENYQITTEPISNGLFITKL